MSSTTLPWLAPGEAFPPVSRTWGWRDPIPGLLAAGGSLDTPTLLRAYRQGIFPWFSEDQPILWWNPNPRMVLRTADFRWHQSLRKEVRAGLRSGALRVTVDQAFENVIQACAQTPRPGQHGTWIVPDIVQAYINLHRAGHAHSVETWWHGELVGGLYCVNIGHMVFGESMFSHRSNASKTALAALVAFCRAHQLPAIDCQQNTAHLASMGAYEIPRHTFSSLLESTVDQTAPHWEWQDAWWAHLNPQPSPPVQP